MKIGILCNGRHTGTKEWKSVVWGEDGKMGQIPTAVRAFHQYFRMGEVVALAFGTGASERNGIPEALVMANYLTGHFEELRNFPYFADMSLEELAIMYVKLEHRTCIETSSKNTAQEFERVMHIFRQREVDLVVDVTSKTHAPRCMRDLGVLWEQEAQTHPMPKEGYVVVSAETGYADVEPGDSGVVIFEYPHRGDTPVEFKGLYETTRTLGQKFVASDTAGRQRLLDGLAAVV